MALTNIKEKAADASKLAKQAVNNQPNTSSDTSEAAGGSGDLDFSFLKVHVDQNLNFKSCQILQTGFIALLQRLGFRRYDKADKTFIVVKVVDNIIEEVSIPNLRVEAARYCNDLDKDALFEQTRCPHNELMEKLYRSLGSLLSDEKMSLLVDLKKGNEFNICTDNYTTGYYFYENGFVEVKKSTGVRLRPYSELPGLVWKDQVLPRKFEVLDIAEIEKAHFYTFMKNVAHTKGESTDENATRLGSLMSITGYNLHRFFDTHLRATILLDARTSDDPDGRSGKSLYCKALRLILNSNPDTGAQCRIIDGKTFQQDNRFKFEELEHNTRLVVFDDIKRDVDLVSFFNAIPDGISVERKGAQGKERVHTKIVFTLNYTLSIRGGSAKDRVLEFEFADYYSSKFKPEHEFKHWFFRDWDVAEWNRFDNLMMWCVDLYMKQGVIQCGVVNLNERKLKDETCSEFVSFMEDLNIEHQREYDKKDLYKKFVDLDDEGKIRNKDLNWMKMRTFTAFLKYWAEYRDEMAGYKFRRSNSTDLIMFFYNQPIQPEHIVGATLYPDKSTLCTPSTESEMPVSADINLPF